MFLYFEFQSNQLTKTHRFALIANLHKTVIVHLAPCLSPDSSLIFYRPTVIYNSKGTEHTQHGYLLAPHVPTLLLTSKSHRK